MEYKFNQAITELNIEAIKKGYVRKFQVISNSMKFLIKRGDFVFVKSFPYNEIKPGDIVVFRRKYLDKLVLHRVIKKVEKDGSYMFFTRGDFNSEIDGDIKVNDEIIGKVIAIKKNKFNLNLENTFIKIFEKIVFIFSRYYVFFRDFNWKEIFNSDVKHLVKNNYLFYFSYHNNLGTWKEISSFLENFKKKYHFKFKKIAELNFLGGYSELSFSFIRDRKNVKLLDFREIEDDENFDLILCAGILSFFSKSIISSLLDKIYKKINKKGFLFLYDFKKLNLILKEAKRLRFGIRAIKKFGDSYSIVFEKE